MNLEEINNKCDNYFINYRNHNKFNYNNKIWKSIINVLIEPRELKAKTISEKTGYSSGQILHYSRYLENINVVSLRKQGYMCTLN